MIHPHIADALKAPDLVRLSDGMVLLRFESMKIYSALAAVRHLLDRGTVRPGQTLVDSSSGIYAHALALACHRYGMRCHIVASTTVDTTTLAQLEILGATVEQVRPSKNLKLDQELRVRQVRAFLAERPDAHWMRQYHDDVHYLGYREVADRVATTVPDGRLHRGRRRRVRGLDRRAGGAPASPRSERRARGHPAVRQRHLRQSGPPRPGSDHRRRSARPSSSTMCATTSTTPSTGWTSPTPWRARSP